MCTDIKRVIKDFLDGCVDTSEMSLDEMRVVRDHMRNRIKKIDVAIDDSLNDYKKLDRLSSERYRLSRKLGPLEDAIIRIQRKKVDVSGLAYKGGGIYTDINDRLTYKYGKHLHMKGISI